MAKFLLRRLVNYLVLVVIATSLGWFLASVSLNPRANFQGRNPPPPPSVVTAQLKDLNVDPQTPLIKRYARWVVGVIHGDFGKTIDGDSVDAEISRRAGVSGRLLLLGTIFGCGFGVLLGAIGAVRQYKPSDQTLTIVSFLLLSIPTFVLAILLEIGAVWVNGWIGHPVFQYTGEYSPEITGFGPVLIDRLQHLVLPTLAIALIEIAIFSRYQRNAMLDVLGSDFVRTALAKGMRRRKALVKHALRTALIPSATLFAYTFGTLFVGATFTEKIFGWHGMGEWAVDSITRQDVNATAAVTCFTAVLILMAGHALRHSVRPPRPPRSGLTLGNQMSISNSPAIAAITDQTGDEPPPNAEEAAISSRTGVVLRRFLARKHGVVGLICLVLLFLLAFVGPHLTHWEYEDEDFTSFL